MPRPVSLRDDITNEVLDRGFLAVEKVKARMPYKTWFYCESGALSRLANVGRLNDIKVFAFMLENMGSNNLVTLTHASIAEMLGMTRPNVSTSIRRLREGGYLHKEGTALVVDETLLWKGELKSFPWKDLPRPDHPKPLEKGRRSQSTA